MKIKFIDSWGDIPPEYAPVPAAKKIPEWYRKMPTYTDSGKIIDRRNANPGDSTGGTAKKCMPFFDAMTSGYLIVLPGDVNVRRDEDGSPWFEWANSQEVIQFHPVRQLPNYPGNESRKYQYPKFYHPWVVKTPPGYSSLFISPIHQDLPFKILEGVVDTDLYEDVILFPFVFTDDNFEGLIPAGTPIAQVIPFKREGWTSEVVPMSDDILRMLAVTFNKVRSVFNDGYKTFFWQRKQYK